MDRFASYSTGDIIEGRPAVMCFYENERKIEMKETRIQAHYRPYVIIGDAVTGNHPLLIVSPVTKKDKGNYPFVQEIMLKVPSYIHYEQVFTIDKRPYKFLRKMNREELKEMELRRNYCLGGARTNILNVEGIEQVRLEGDTYHGVVRYRLGHDVKFSLARTIVQSYFGPLPCEKVATQTLHTVPGLQLILSEGVLI